MFVVRHLKQGVWSVVRMSRGLDPCPQSGRASRGNLTCFLIQVEIAVNAGCTLPFILGACFCPDAGGRGDAGGVSAVTEMQEVLSTAVGAGWGSAWGPACCCLGPCLGPGRGPGTCSALLPSACAVSRVVSTRSLKPRVGSGCDEESRVCAGMPDLRNRWVPGSPADFHAIVCL